MIYSFLSTIIMMFVIVASASSQKKLYINETNIVKIKEEISKSLVDRIISELLVLNNSRGYHNYPLYISIESSGGSTYQAMRLVQFTKSINNVHTICIYCASAAHAIMQGVEGTRYATLNNITMAHETMIGLQGYFNIYRLQEYINTLKISKKPMDVQTAKRLKLSLQEYTDKIKNEWNTAGIETVNQNVADEIVTIICSKELLEDKTNKLVNTAYGPRYIAEDSKCPLI